MRLNTIFAAVFPPLLC